MRSLSCPGASCLFALLLAASASSSAADGSRHAPRVADPDYLARLVDDGPPPLPRGLAPHERGLALPWIDPLAPLVAPEGRVRAQAEYEPDEGILIRWGGFNALHTAMVVPLTTAERPSDVFVVVADAAAQASASGVLAGGGADMARVHFIVAPTDSVWMRDYGPRFIEHDGRRAIVDHVYNRPRPRDDAFPPLLGPLWQEDVFELPLTHGGGNFHLFRNREAFMTRLVANENPGVSEQQIVDDFRAYEGVDVTLTDPFPTSYDSTQHIDMWMLPLGDGEVLIGQYEASEGGGVPKAVTDATADLMAARGYTVLRLPGWRASGTHYTYANAVISNGVALICRFGGAYADRDAQALATFESALPDRAVVQVDCNGIIGLAGAMHCIVMHVPDLLFRDDFGDP